MKHILFLSLSLLLLVSCSSPVSSIEGNIEKVEEDHLKIDCSEVVNRDKKEGEAVDSKGYFCLVDITEDTVLMNANGDEVKKNDLRTGQHVEITLLKEKNIGESIESRKVTAKEIKSR
ncbi:hypothetical protein [Pseudalkalibacillus sp. SCS-8]|uniref:hypothetical protein n=1 Tax=Pseudalkalibacillus nanhaiensis TaxID=3115291 RepID=UPI0032D9C500